MLLAEKKPPIAPVQVEQGSFFEANKNALYDLFVALDREEEWKDNPVDLVPYTLAKWVGQEHGNSDKKDQFTQDQIDAAQKPLEDMGLKNKILPPIGYYEQIHIIGGMTRVNRERMGFVKEHIDNGRISATEILFWAGQRLRDKRDDAQVETMDMSSLAEDSWVRDELKRDQNHGWDSAFATETDLARLAYLERFKSAELINTIPVLKQEDEIAGIPNRTALGYTYRTSDYPDTTVMNFQAVERPHGPPRHTTSSCASEWVKNFAPLNHGKVLLVSGNPHIERTLKDVSQVAYQYDRGDIEIVACGPAANPKASVQLLLGEVGCLLLKDAERVIST